MDPSPTDPRQPATSPDYPTGEPSPPPASAPGPPGWGYPEGYVAPAPPVPAPARPGSVTAAAVILIVLGVLVGLFGALSLLAGALFPTVADSPEFRDQFGNVSDALGGLLLTFGIVLLAYGGLQVITGIFVRPGRGWARISGLVVAVLGILISLVGVLPGEGSSAGVSLVFVALVAAYAYATWVLASTGSWFSR
jgi:hypothetical protein